MELQIKKDDHHHAGGGAATTGQKLSPQQFLAQIAQRQQSEQNADEVAKKKRPNLSVINPSLFYEQYPRTSSPVVYASKSSNIFWRFWEKNKFSRKYARNSVSRENWRYFNFSEKLL